MKHFLSALFVAALSGDASAQVHYQYVPDSPAWPQAQERQHTPTTNCVTVTTQQNGDQRYPSASYTTCN